MIAIPVLLFGLGAAGGRFAVVAETLYTMGPAGVLKNAVVVVEGGKIASIEKAVPAGVRIVKARAVMPGLVDLHTHLGVYAEPLVESHADGNEMSNPVTPHVRAIDAFHVADPAIRAAVAGGTTTVIARPGSGNVIGGIGVLLKLKPGKGFAEMVVREEADLKMALEWNPILVYGGKGKTPATRMAVYAIARKAFVAAREYVAAWERYGREKASGKRDAKEPDRDLGKEALAKVLRREIPVHIHTARADEVIAALDFVEEFRLDAHIGHAEWGYLVAGEVARRKGRVVVGPRLFRPNPETQRLDNIAALYRKAGVEVALTTDHPVVAQGQFLTMAAHAVKYGLPRDDALRALTIVPARFARIDDRVGSIEKGKDADLVLLTGDPIELTTRVEEVYVDGVRVWSGKKDKSQRDGGETQREGASFLAPSWLGGLALNPGSGAGAR
ncbi:MAG: amidohydrolase family protein [Deltaproteobacteria bacterium]|nr:amidohydrolase family protein [Deltaproteobacteria bacterium]